MGTRNLTIAILDGKPRIAQYGQWDGNPEGQGAIALQFLHGMDRAAFISKLRRCRFLGDSAEDKAYVEKVDATPNWPQVYPALTRDTGAEILQLVQDWSEEGEILLGNQYDFAADSLMCEWAYVIDFDKDTFEVYKGFNEEPLPASERFSTMPPKPSHNGQIKYHPVKLVATFSLTDLPTEDTFITACRGPEEEDDD